MSKARDIADIKSGVDVDGDITSGGSISSLGDITSVGTIGGDNLSVGGSAILDGSGNLKNIASIDATTDAAIASAGFSKTTGDITNVSAGGGLSGGGASGDVTVSHADTSSQGSVNNSGNTVIQDISVDTYGHITGLSSTTINTTPPTTTGAVGTYGYFHKSSTGGTLNPGATLSGSSLKWSGTNPKTAAGGDIYWWDQPSTSPGGTWKSMGASNTGNAPGDFAVATLFVRIS